MLLPPKSNYNNWLVVVAFIVFAACMVILSN